MASHSCIGVASLLFTVVAGIGGIVRFDCGIGVPLGMLVLGNALGCRDLGSGTSIHTQHSRHQPYPHGWTAASAPNVASLNVQQPLHHCGGQRRLSLPMGERLRAMAGTTLVTTHAAKNANA